MKQFLVLVAALLIVSPVLLAQPVDPNKRDEDLTKAEADIRIAEWNTKVNGLQTELDGLNNETTALNTQMTQVMNDSKKCQEEIYALLGATEADVNNFRERLGRIESRVREISRMPDDQLGPMIPEVKQLEAQLSGMRREKLAVLPEFYNKIIDIQREINGIYGRATAKPSGTYTVGTWSKDRDCLWNIAGKEAIYNDPRMWPKIYVANKDQIRNPDIIFPGQQLQIPTAGPKSDEELRAERLYYRKKRLAAAAISRRAHSERSQEVEQSDAGSGNK
jgi:FtsZ-binding cell division protein ZapB